MISFSNQSLVVDVVPPGVLPSPNKSNNKTKTNRFANTRGKTLFAEPNRHVSLRDQRNLISTCSNFGKLKGKAYTELAELREANGVVERPPPPSSPSQQRMERT